MLEPRRRRSEPLNDGEPMTSYHTLVPSLSVALCIVLILTCMGAASAKCFMAASEEDRRSGPLVTLTVHRAANVEDKHRAALLLTAIPETLHDYRRREVAEASGYDYDRGVERGAPFDPHLPIALLYAPPSATSSAVLVGALYTVEPDATGDSLDTIVPLSIARWAWIRPRCRKPGPDLWTLEVFPFENSGERIWRVPMAE